MALRVCPSLVIVRGDWEWYKRCSEGFLAICRSYSPVLQQFSIDECFIDMTLRCTPENAVAVATRLKDQIREALGFTVNVGIGSNKLLAKLGTGSLTRLVGLGVSKLTHESAIQMSLFEDPKMEYYREWDRQYDEQQAKAEDAQG